MKVISLAENTCRSDSFETEHGLSLYIEARGKRILFDAGQSRLFSENALRLGVDLSTIDLAVLSHGHYDHGGGLEKFLEINRTAPVYLKNTAHLPHFSGERFIGIDPTLAECGRLVFSTSL